MKRPALIMLLTLLTTLSSQAQDSIRLAEPVKDDLFDRSVVGLKQVRPIGDIEGKSVHFKALAAEGHIKWNAAQNRWDIVNPNVILVFNGDVMRRGPFGIRANRAILDLAERFPKQVRVSLGNHDGNILSFFAVQAEIESGLVTEARLAEKYAEWLKKNGARDSLSSQILFWAQRMGITEKIDNFWLEMVLLKLGAGENEIESPLEKQFWRTEATGGKKSAKLDRAALERVVSLDAMAAEFYEFIRPGGRADGAWKLLEKAKLHDAITGKDSKGGRTIITISHSGLNSRDSFGVVPTVTARYIVTGENQTLIADPKRGLDPQNPNPTRYFFAWLQDLEKSFKIEQLQGLAAKIAEFRATPKTDVARRQTLAQYIWNFEIIHNVDAKWSEVTGAFYRTDSQVYPDPKQITDNSLPAISEPPILTAEARIGVVGKLGGHKPIGDFATYMLGFDPVTGRFVGSLFHDTSYSPVEGNNRVEMWENGATRVTGYTRDGLEMVMERPGQETLRDWEKIASDFKKKAADALAKTGEKLEPSKEVAAIIDRVDRYSRLGRVAGGRLVVGFAAKKAADGTKTVDYDTYITLVQEGHTYTYEKVEVWGLIEYEKKTGPLEYPQTDLTKMMEKAEAEKAAALRKLGKKVIDRAQFDQAVDGKKVRMLFGPAANFSQVLQDADGARYVPQSLAALRNELMAVPANEALVIVAGGTLGWEAEKTKVAKEVNQARIAASAKPFRIIGAAALVFGLGEIDPSVDEFFLIPRTFYWGDFYVKLMNNHLLPSKMTGMLHDFGGGGPIVNDQIGQAMQYSSSDSRLSVRLERGITVEVNNLTHKRRGASDKWADKIADSSGFSTRALSVVQANSNGTFSYLFGTQPATSTPSGSLKAVICKRAM